jgi:hypothetical protein
MSESDQIGQNFAKKVGFQSTNRDLKKKRLVIGEGGRNSANPDFGEIGQILAFIVRI